MQYPFVLVYIWWFPPWRHTVVWHHAHFLFLGNMTRAQIHVEFMKGWCVYSSSVKQCLTIGESRAISHANDTTASATSDWKSSGQQFSSETPLENADYKFFVSEEDDNNKNRQSRDVITTLSTVKGMLSIQRQQTCTEAVEKNTTIHSLSWSIFCFQFLFHEHIVWTEMGGPHAYSPHAAWMTSTWPL